MSHLAPSLHALSIKELLHEIFFYSTERDNVSNACVCKSWSDEALSLLWSTVHAHSLVLLLAPLKEDLGRISFSRAINASDWLRFDKYASRVRSLTLGCDPESRYDQAVFSEIALTRPRHDLLPHLTSVDLVGSPTILPLFCSPSVHDLLFRLDETSVEILDRRENDPSLFSYLPSTTPGLRSIRITSEEDISFLSVPFVLAVHGLPSLEIIDIPASLMTDTVLDSLGLLPALQSLTISSCSIPCVATFTSLQGSDCFPALKHLHAEITFHEAVSWFSLPQCPTVLNTLSILSHCEEDQWRELLRLIASRLCALQSLCIFSYAPLTFEAFSPVLSLKKLAILELLCAEFKLDEQKLVTLVEALPLLESLLFLSTSIQTQYPDLSSLAVMAPFSANLKSLTLRFDTTGNMVLPNVVIPFASLDILNVSNSSMSKPIPVAKFLSRILPPTCSLKFVHKDWKLVKELIPAFMDVRNEALATHGHRFGHDGESQISSA